jgi:hypothetical protein
VKFKFTKKNSDILPGMYAKISVKIGNKKEPVIPYDALTSRGGIVGVFVLFRMGNTIFELLAKSPSPLFHTF